MKSDTLTKWVNSAAWKYVVLFAASISYMAGYGFNYGIVGPLVIAQSKHFNISITESTWIGAVNLAVYQFSSPVGAVLARLLTLRTLQMIGGTISVVGIGVSALSTKSWHMILSFGVLIGFGTSLSRNACLGMVQQYFDDDLSNFAFTALVLGISLGVTTVPILANYLFSHLEFAHALLLLTPFMALHILAGLAFTERSVEEREETDRFPELTKERNDKNGILISSVNVLTNFKVWCYAWSGFIRMFALTSFFSLIPNYMMEEKGLSSSEAAFGETVVGFAAIAGGVCICALVTMKRNLNLIIPHALIHIHYGIAVLLITIVQNKVSYWILMGLFGCAYGIFCGIHLTVATKLGDPKDMLLASSVERILQGVSSSIGSPLTSYIQEVISLTAGLYVIGAVFIVSGFIAGLIRIPAGSCIRSQTSTSDEEHKRMVESAYTKHDQHNTSSKQELQPLIDPNR